MDIGLCRLLETVLGIGLRNISLNVSAKFQIHPFQNKLITFLLRSIGLPRVAVFGHGHYSPSRTQDSN